MENNVSPMPKEKNYHVRKFSTNRLILADYNNVAATFYRVSGLIEIDITAALARMEEIKQKENYKVSMTAWVAKCLAQAVIENKHLNSYRKGRKLIVFDDVDISVVVEITTKSGKKVPFNHVIRKVETKSVKEITDEIRAVQQRKIDELEQLTRDNSTKYMWFYPLLPRFFRRFVIRRMLKNPFRLKKLIGTVGITSLGMFVKGQGGWAVPFADKTLNIALGGIREQAILRDGKAVEQKLLCVTFLVDHDIVDGAPAARFIARLSKLMTGAAYLKDLTEK